MRNNRPTFMPIAALLALRLRASLRSGLTESWRKLKVANPNALAPKGCEWLEDAADSPSLAAAPEDVARRARCARLIPRGAGNRLR
jgi:hypothetical protein